MKAKKAIVTLLLLGSVGLAGAALARGHCGQGRAVAPYCPPAQEGCWGQDLAAGPGCEWQGQRPDACWGRQDRPCFGAATDGWCGRPAHGDRNGGWGARRGWILDLPQELQEKAKTLEKLRIDLDYALASTPIDRPKALELYGQIQKLRDEIQTAAFTRRLDWIEEAAAQRRLNGTVKPGAPNQGTSGEAAPAK